MSNLRVRIAVLILGGLILLSLFSAAAVRGSCAELIAQAETVLTANDPKTEIDSLIREWNQQRVLLHFFVPNQPMTELNSAILQLDALYDAKSDTLSSELHAIIARLQWIHRTELSVF